MSQQAQSSICLICTEAALRPQAETLAKRLRIPLQQKYRGYPLALILDASGLSLKLTEKNAPGAIRADFVGGSLGHRRRYGGGRGQDIAKAVGLKAGRTPSVLDVNAGLGRDAFILALLGCQVTMLERSPVIAALLEDGLQRAALDLELSDWLPHRLRLIQGDALRLISELPAADVIYLDPMYPSRKKSSLVKKEMRIIRAVVGDDTDADQLLQCALQNAGKKVVVKRPKGAEYLATTKPHHSIESKTTRFDVYLSENH